MTQVRYAIAGDDRVFAVDVDLENETTDCVKDKIKAAHPNLIPSNAAQLTLYFAKDTEDIFMGRGSVKLLDALKLAESDMQLLVVLPNAKKRRVDDIADPPEGSDLWRKAFSEGCVRCGGLPSLDSLPVFAATELPVKIGLKADTMARVRSETNRLLCDKLFVEDLEVICRELWEDAFLRILQPTRQWSGPTTEKEFHRAWGVVVRELLTAVFGLQGQFTTRDVHDKHATDFAFEFHDVNVFHGEEESPTWREDPGLWIVDDMAVARRRLRDELRWSYGEKVPYIIGYAASGYQCALHAMHTADLEIVKTTTLGVFNTQNAIGRFQFALALLQLCRLFPAIAERSSKRREFGEITRPDGVVVTMTPTYVTRDYTNVQSSYLGISFRERLEATEFFRVTMLGIPHVECTEEVSACGLRIKCSPRGFAVLPQSLDELFHAVECVLTALVKLHEKGWMHRDIRWSNVLQYRDAARGWFLTDFVHATTSPQELPTGEYFRRVEHAPELSTKGKSHTTAVDLWSVGQLVAKWKIPPGATQESWSSDAAREAWMSELLAYDPDRRPTAAQALATLQALHARAYQ